MVTAEVTAIIASASAVAGGAIVGASNYVINRVQAADARKAELRSVLIEPRDCCVAPPNLLPALGQLTEAMDGAENRDEAWWACWNAARTNYFLRCREAVGFAVPEPAVTDANNDDSASA